MRARGYQRSRGGGSGRLRIVGGRWRGRRLRFPAGRTLRPTPERTRETLYDWLQGRVEGASALDLFAGSGALGLEALSRGAAHVTFVERDRGAAVALEANLAELRPGTERAGGALVVRADALAWLGRLAEDEDSRAGAPWDLVLIDPPFEVPELPERALAALERPSLLADDARVFCEHPARRPLETGRGWRVLRETRAGDAAATLLGRG